jgi:sodium-dependent dicarboxylate transporter 2/3/5
MSANRIAFWGGPIVALFVGLGMFYGGVGGMGGASGMSMQASLTLAVTLWCIIWWIFEPIPIPATSLIPLTVLPLAGVLSKDQISSAYGNPLILLLLSGFLLSTALEKNDAHRRLAIMMLRLFGGSSSRQVVIGFMAASAVLSMWISNTATALMLLPVAGALIDKARDPQLKLPLLLGIAYGCSIGGLGTPIGTPPNVVFMGIYAEVTGTEISFVQWMSWGLPIVVVLLPVAALWLTRNLKGGGVELPGLGPWQARELRVLGVFALTALAWVTRSEPFGGWSSALDLGYTNDAMVGFVGVLAMFVINNGEGKGETLLDWDTANKIPWGILLLFAGGLAIAAAFMSSGLSAIVGQALTGAGSLHPLLLMVLLCTTVTFLTEATSNTATSTLLLPIVAATAIAASIDPRLLMVPVAMSASCAFMLPVATPPNVIVFSTGEVPISAMVREGFALNLAGIFIISGGLYLLL